jgi:hypothetical protein
MTGSLFTFPRTAPLYNGAVVPGGKIFTYLTGSSTPAATYTTPDLSVAHSNPIVADSAGVFAPFYLSPANGRYRIVWTNSAEVQLTLDDNVPSEYNASQRYTVEAAAPYIDLIETDATANNGGWRIQADAETLTINTMNDAKSVFTPIITLSGRAQGVASPFISGAFTPAWSGFGTDPTGDITFYRFGRLVILVAPTSGNTATSDATDMGILNVPFQLRPDTATNIPCVVIDNGASAMGTMSFGGLSTFEFAIGTAPPSNVGFTNTGTKGLPAGAVIMYTL